MKEIKQLIITGPYDEPKEHWRWNDETRNYERTSKRRPAGYVKASESDNKLTRGKSIHIKLVNDIRPRVKIWRDDGYPGITTVTRRLLQFWKNDKRARRLFFCQIEAMETIIWLTEANDNEKLGLNIPKDGGEFARRCFKMATGTGKTIVMGMLITWMTLNKLDRPTDSRFSKYFLMVAPNITVTQRLGVLDYTKPDNYYLKYELVPESLYDKLREGHIIITNWHKFKKSENNNGVVRKGPESDEDVARRILGHRHDNIIVINDEAHHAWRKNDGNDENKLTDDEMIATLWMGGLDKIHKARNIRGCFDFTATPFIPSGRLSGEDDLFGWIISDFSLNDAIESGLVKTPRMPAADDVTKPIITDESDYYHIYDNETVRTDLQVARDPLRPLPDLVRNGYALLGADWQKTSNIMKDSRIPPVMITICNTTNTAARIENFFKTDLSFDVAELKDEECMCRVDSDVMQEYKGSKKDVDLREKVNTVGQIDKSGEQIRNIIAVQMLSEGWDANNVTHVMGLRAFTSQLLCEQVVGRGLRRQSYELNEEGMFNPEYVNIIGVPFAFLPHEGGNDTGIIEPRILIRPDPMNMEHEIAWPNVERINIVMHPELEMDWENVKELRVDGRKCDTIVHVAPVLESNIPDLDLADKMELEDTASHIRMQRIMFHVSQDIYRKIEAPGPKYELFARLVRLAEEFIDRNMIRVMNLPDDLEIRKRLAIIFNMNAIINHIRQAIIVNNTMEKTLALKPGREMKSTFDVMDKFTTSKVLDVKKSHINPQPYNRGWEKKAIQEMERNDRVESWTRADNIGFGIPYMFRGNMATYKPDFMAKLTNPESGNSVMLILEIKGQELANVQAKNDALKEWVETVNDDGRFGTWASDIAMDPKDVPVILGQHYPE